MGLSYEERQTLKKLIDEKTREKFVFRFTFWDSKTGEFHEEIFDFGMPTNINDDRAKAGRDEILTTPNGERVWKRGGRRDPFFAKLPKIPYAPMGKEVNLGEKVRHPDFNQVVWIPWEDLISLHNPTGPRGGVRKPKRKRRPGESKL